MKTPRLALRASFALCLFSQSSQAATVFAVADGEVTESSAVAAGTGAVSGGNGISGAMNYRWTGDGVAPVVLASTNRNDVTAVRFDLTGYTLADLQDVTLSFTSHRTGTSNPVKIWGVSSSATPTTGANTASDWVDTSGMSFNTMPGLIFDGDSKTQGLNLSQLTELQSTTTTSALTRGQVVSFSDAAITTFINSYAGTSVTFYLTGNAEVSGQTRFATRDTIQLDTTAPAPPIVAAGTYAPTLSFNLVPEPSSLILAGLGALALVSRRRRD